MGDPAYARWVKRRLRALFTVDTWIAMVHRSHCPDFDHTVGNVAAHMALAHDYLGDAYSESETKELADGLRKKFLLPYLEAVRGRKAWWAGRELTNDWKIMSHGEAGLAICEFGEYWPETREALAHAAIGVVEILDAVPPEGDWHQGVNYWFGTLYYGLRYATALRRLTGGAVNVYQHPAMKKTGDFAMMLTTPGKRAYNFEYNKDTMSHAASTAGAQTT